MSNGHLVTEERENGRNLPVDYFLRSLAQNRSSRAIGVVLSGTASDGTLGLKAVKTEGGVTFAQEPSSAKFDGMPRSAITAGVVDFVLTPEEIARRLVRLSQSPPHTALGSEDDEVHDAQKTEPGLDRIFHLLRTVTGNDFTHYKHTTIRRRIHRRIALRRNETLEEYVAYLQQNPAEVRALADDLLICVTAFFRDPETLQALESRVFPEMVKDRMPEDTIRVWVPGCATGEEAYTIAICLTEFLERSGTNVPVRIYATDVSDSALEKARVGIYPTAALAEVSPARLKRFFQKNKDHYEISKSIRATCVFAQQNVARDPPFYNLDLISCCNLLIYFDAVLQRKALSAFHYALKPGGILVLGPSESVSPLSHTFKPLGRKLKLYANYGKPTSSKIASSAGDSLPVKWGAKTMASGGVRETLTLQRRAERMLLAQYAPAGVIVDDALNIVHVCGDTSHYLQLASGEPTYGLLRMAREGLVVGLRTALLKAKQRNASVTERARVKHRRHFKDVNLRVTPINDPSAPVLHFMVVFEDVAAPAPIPKIGKEQERADAQPRTNPGARGARENAALKQELVDTRDYLQSIIEEQEAAGEELKSANEEAQASNEELETAKEELQSTNEELNTVNDELKTRNIALAELNNDLSNVLSSINVPLLMVGRDLSIRRFTPSIEPMLNLIESDVGRSILGLQPNIDLPDLEELLRGVIHGAAPRPREIKGPDGGWFSVQALPYHTYDRIEGALLVMLDVDVVRRGRAFAEAIIETVRQPLVILSKDLKVRRANRAFYESFNVQEANTEGRFFWDLGNGQWNIPKLLEALNRILPEKGEFERYEIEHDFEGIGHRAMLLNAREIRQETPFGGPAILLAIDDITDRKRVQNAQLDKQARDQKAVADKAMHDKEAELARVARTMMVGEMATYLAHEINQPLAGVVTNAEAGMRWLRREPAEINEAIASLASVVRDGTRASAVVRQIRDFVRNETTEPVALEMGELIREALNFLQSDFEKNQITLNSDLAGNLQVKGNRVQLEQVILNLAMNASQSMIAVADRPRQMLVSARRSSDKEVLVSVRDSGVGLDRQLLDRMFEAFFTTKSQGIGMGLPICLSIVQAHGGRIWATNNDGPGLTVQFTLPMESESSS
jgi:two-component system CheB/CheR fusion protein